MDLKDLTPKNDTVVVTVIHPFEGKVLKNEDGTDMTIELYADYSKHYKEELHRQTNVKLKRMQKKGVVDMTAQQIEESALDMMVALTKSWNITYEGDKIPCNSQNVKKLYQELFWLKDQLEEGLAEAKDFTKT